MRRHIKFSPRKAHCYNCRKVYFKYKEEKQTCSKKCEDISKKKDIELDRQIAALCRQYEKGM